LSASRRRAADPDFRADWQRLALARAAAAEVIRDRAHHELSQRALAQLLAVSQPRVVALESGEHNPTIDKLIAIGRGPELL
jgi:DNA-binding XRE family transcriptional regulator